MALSPFNDNIDIFAPKSLDNKYTIFTGGIGSPFTSVAQANAHIPARAEYRSRGLTMLIMDGGIATEYWYRDGVADVDLIPKRFSIVTTNTNSLFLSGTGSAVDPLYGDVQLSKQANNAIRLFQDGIYATNTIKQGVVYGGVVTWVTGYSYHVSAAGYYINGNFYSSPAADFTLSAPDGTFNRIDTFIVNNTGVAVVLEGIPSADPAQASLDPATQLQLSFAIVETGTTEPTIGTECIYIDNTEWTTLASSGTINPNSTTTPCNGTKSVNGTSVLTGDNIKFTRSSVLNPTTNYTVLKFSIKSKGAFGGNGANKRKLYFQFRNGVTNVGARITFLDASYGFSDTNTSTCQTIAIPLTDFSFPSGATIDNLVISVGGLGVLTGFWIDDICFQGVPVAPPPLTGGITADNGLNMSTSTNVELGGPLTKVTGINTGSAYSLNFTGSTPSGTNAALVTSINSGSTGNAFYGQATDGRALYGVVTSGVGVYGLATSGIGVFGNSTSSHGGYFQSISGIGAEAIVAPSSTNTVVNILKLSRVTSGTAANGIGGSIEFYNELVDGVNYLTNSIVSKATDATVGTRTSQLIIKGVSNAVTADLFTLSGSGSARLNKYGVGTFFDTTAIYSLGVKSDGTIVEFSPAAGGGTEITLTTLGTSGAATLIGDVLNIPQYVGTIYTSDNAITKTADNFQLGGTLLQNTTIVGGAFGLILTGTSSTVSSLNISNNSIGAGSIVNISSTSVAAASNLQKGLNISLSGANPTAFQSTYGIYSSNTHTGSNPVNYAGYFTSTNIGVYSTANVIALWGVATGTGSGNTGVGGSTVDSGGYGVSATNTSTTANSSIALTALSSGGLAANLRSHQASTNSVNSIVRVISTSSGGIGASGIGGSIDYYNATTTSGSTVDLSTRLISKFTNATAGAQTSQFIITGVNSGTIADLFTLSGSGATKLNKYGIGTFTGTPVYTLQVDASGNIIEGTAGGGLTSITADNGLTANTSSNVQLGSSSAPGSALLFDTYINTGAFYLKLTGTATPLWSTTSNISSAAILGTNTSSGNGVEGTSSSGYGGGFTSTSGIAVTAQTTSGTPLTLQATPSSTNTVVALAQITRSTSSTGAAGLGGSIDFYLEPDANTSRLSNQLISKWTTAADATRTSQFIITGVNSATSQDLLRISGAGIFELVQGLSDYANDTAAATGGIPINGLYKFGSIVMIRVS